MAIQVNIFEAGSVPTAQELITIINELNTTLDESVTLTGEQSITGVKTFLGNKLLKFKQSVSADKLGFTLYDYQGKEVGNFEYDNKNNFRLLALGNYVSATNQEVECNIGFKIYNKLQSAAYRLLCPLAGNAKNSIPSLSETYTNFYMPLIFTNGATSVTADNSGKVDLSTLIGSGSGDVSGLATVATTGDYNDLLNLPTLFSGNYNDLTNKPTLFSGDYNDLTNKPTIPVVDITKAQADGWYQPKGNYALKSELFSGSYNDLTDKPSLFSGNYNDLTNKPTLFSGSYNDLSDKPTIPTVPTISTNITSDATSDTKTASPKAVKEFVEGKGYLTQHQDISGKADATDLEALEDRVEALEQGDSGSTDEDKSVKLVKDPTNYLKASVGDIIKYNGTTTSSFTHGHDYECTKKGNAAYSVSSGDYVLDVAESATNEDFIAAMANEVKPFKYSERVDFSGYIEYSATTNPNVILGCSNKTKANLAVDDVLISVPYMTPISVITAVSGSTVTAKLLSTGVEFEVQAGLMYDDYYAYVFTNLEDTKVIITDDDFLRMMEPDPLPQSQAINLSNINIGIAGKKYSGTGTNITITKYYQNAEVAGTLSEWVEAKPCDCGDTTQYSYLKLIPDLDAYTEAPVGEIVKYTGQSNNKYTRGWDYEKKEITLEQGLYITSIDYPTSSSSGVLNRQAALQTAFENFDFTSLKATNETGKMYIIKNVNDTPFYSTEPTLSVGSKLFETTKGRECEIKSETSDYYIVNNWGLENPDATNENNQIRKNFSVQTINVPKFRDNSGNEVWVYTNDDIVFYFPNLEWTMESYGTTIQQNRYIVVDRTHGNIAEVNYQNVQEPSVIPSWQPIIYPSAPVSSGN